jgi:hypothetical protein
MVVVVTLFNNKDNPILISIDKMYSNYKGLLNTKKTHEKKNSQKSIFIHQFNWYQKPLKKIEIFNNTK